MQKCTGISYSFRSPSPKYPSVSVQTGASHGTFRQNVYRHGRRLGLRLSEIEHEVLGALSEAGSLTVSKLGEIAGVDDGLLWVKALVAKLAGYGIDLVARGEDVDGEPAFVLVR